MKKIYLMAFITLSGWCLQAQDMTLPPTGGNQKSEVSQWMGPVKVTVTYNSPDVTAPNGADRKGKIWGQLVPYGMVNLGYGTAALSPWRAGANENTTIEFSHAVKVEGKDLAAGKYGFHIIPAETGPWTLIFSKDHAAWGSYYYEEKNDALRVQVTPVQNPHAEWLNYGFEDRELSSTTAFLEWESLKIPFKISVDNVNDLYVQILRAELKSAKANNWESWVQAVAFCVQNNINLEEALYWSEQSLTTPYVGEVNFSTLATKSSVLRALGRVAEADEALSQAANHPTANMQQIHMIGRQLIAGGQPEKALEIFKLNRKKNPTDTFTTIIGLARGYEAVGNKKEAIKNWELAIKNLPENQKAFKGQYEAELARLKDNK